MEKINWKDINREALVYFPAASSQPSPVLFAFHGHGGTDKGFAQKGFELQWPEAIVVYPQGLPTTNHSDTKGLQSGWQHTPGEVNPHTGIKDQDVKFFDAMLNTLITEHNAQCIFVHGWSNGGEFTYNVLWSMRGDNIAAIAPASAILNTTTGKKPKAVFHTAGTGDPLVDFDRQSKGVDLICTLNECNTICKVVETGGLQTTHYVSKLHEPVVMCRYSGGHSYPDNVPQGIVNFFKNRYHQIINKT